MKLALYLFLACLGFQAAPPQHLMIHCALGPELQNAVSGRLLVFVAHGMDAKEVDTDPFHPAQVYVAAKEVANWTPGVTVDVDADDIAFPTGLSEASAGDYQLQAVLDVGHTYNYSGRSAEDPISGVVTLKNWNPAGGIEQTVVLSRPAQKANSTSKEESVDEFAFSSKALARFWGHAVAMRGLIVKPPSYQANLQQRFPTVYYTHGFGGSR